MKKILRFFATIGILLVLCIFVFIGTLFYTEYKPELKEKIDITQNGSGMVQLDKSYSMLTWNIGYGALGDYSDFFMDGGKMVQTSTKKQVEENIYAIRRDVQELMPDFINFQEIDTGSKRSYDINEVKRMDQAFSRYASSFAYNFKVLYVPYPLPPIGKVNSGIATYSSKHMESSIRYALPTSFKWPTKVANLKRCLLINTLPIYGSKKKLVIINLHLEAYDEGEAKVMQTKVLKQVMDTEVKKGNYVIACGDFNQSFSSYKGSINNGKWKPGEINVKTFSQYQCLMDPSTYTCRSLEKVLNGQNLKTFPQYLLDGYIVSKNVKVEKIQTIQKNFKHTDHNPVYLKFSLN